MLRIQTDKILQQEMDRKLFLKTTGIALIGLIGVTTITKRLAVFGETLGGSPLQSTGSSTTTSAKSLAYGSAPYGV